MGQGAYTMIAFGTRAIPTRPDSIDEDDWYGWDELLKTKHLRTQYECEPYLVIPLVTNDPVVSERRKCLCMDGVAWSLSELETILKDPLEQARKQWYAAQQEAATHNRTLQDGELLLICDFD